MTDTKLYYGDKLNALRKHIASKSVDLKYLDPTFDCPRNYNVLFGKHDIVNEASDAAQLQAFSDTLVGTHTTEEQYVVRFQGGPWLSRAETG